MKLLLMDDHALFSKSLTIALADAPEIQQFTSTNDRKHLEILLKEEPDILLIDIHLGSFAKEDGLQLAKSILTDNPLQKIVILSGYDLPVYRKEARKIGAQGFISKEIEPDTLLHILLEIQKGATYFPQETIFLEDLTDTEKKVLQLLAAGMKRKTIAQTLYLSERTISNHLQHIFEKLQVSSAVEAITKSIQLGYLPPLQ